MDPAHVVAAVCANQDTATQILAWVGGSALVASPLAWLSAHFRLLPPWAQSLLQLAAANLVHAVAGEPVSKP